MEPATQSTTSVDWYKVVTDDKCVAYRNLVTADLELFDFPEYDYTGNLKELILYVEELRSVLNEANSYVVPTMQFDVAGAIRERFQSKVLDYTRRKTQCDEQIDTLLKDDREAYEEECRRIRADAEACVAPIKRKHDTLLSYKEKLQGVMIHYGITPNDTKISEDISREEFETLLDAALVVCSQTDRRANKLVQKALLPLNEEPAVAGTYSAVLLVASWLLLPFISVGYVVTMLRNTKQMYRNMDGLRLAESLMYTVNFDKYIPQDDKYVVPEYDDTDIREQVRSINEDLEQYNPEPAIQKELQKFKTTDGLTYVSTACENVYNEMKGVWQEAVHTLETRYRAAKELADAEMGKQQKLGDYANKSTVLWTKYVLGYENGVIPVYHDFGLTNINFVGTYSPEIVDFIKVMFINTLLGIRANGLETHVVDTEYLGQSFSEFVTPKTAPYIFISPKDVFKDFELMQQKASENILAIKNNTILEYNAKNEELGMVTRTYHLFIYLTGLGDKFHENKPVMEFMKYSANAGVMVWTVYPQKIPGCLNIKVPMALPSGEPIHYDYDLGSRAIDTFIYDLENNKPRALDYRSGFLEKYLPKEKWWTKSSTKAINVHLGLEEGDPAKPIELHFDDKNVHFLLGGATGAGKSVAIDCTMQTMIHEYAPDEFQMVYVDMKNVEVAKYTRDGVSLIPHAIIVAGTTDGEYCLSVFDWAFEEMIRRGNVCKKYGVQKVEDLRKKFDDPSLPNYDHEVHIPRMVILIDEFQVMFDATRIPQKIIDKITGRITSMVKLARAASIHLWFTSQEMSGTLPKNVLDNFSIRGALRCTKDVSSSLIGNPASGTIKDKVGWMYSNDSAGQDPNANKLWKIPFAPGDDLMQGIYELQEKAEKEGRLCLHAPFFDEKEGRTKADLYKAYEVEPGFKKPTFMVLGDRTIYSTKPTPTNFAFADDDKENLFCTASERQDALDLIGTFVDNVMLKDGEASLLINTADRDTAFLLNLEQYMPEGWEEFLDPSRELEDILGDLEEVMDIRIEQEEEEGKESLKPCYIFLLMWEKKSGIGQDEKYQLTERLVKIIRELNALRVHFIFISREKGIPTSLVNLCNHRICAKCDERTCLQVVDDITPFKYPGVNGDEACFAVYKYGSDMKKFKIYRYKLERELEAREL